MTAEQSLELRVEAFLAQLEQPVPIKDRCAHAIANQRDHCLNDPRSKRTGDCHRVDPHDHSRTGLGGRILKDGLDAW